MKSGDKCPEPGCNNTLALIGSGNHIAPAPVYRCPRGHGYTAREDDAEAMADGARAKATSAANAAFYREHGRYPAEQPPEGTKR